ncbi:MAG: DUF3459 domain-containing protein [Phycisphaerales bacterium]|nr:DUF3459 domain-containing protein [Phycisphaerales bacterium]
MLSRFTFPFSAVLVVSASAFGQATTEKSPATPAYQPPRERDAQGHVTGPGRVGWWNDVVFYEVFVRSFFDSRSGPKANDGIGDLQGLIDRLDYLNDGDPKTDTDLGIGGLWLMPVMQSPSYHGYDIVDYRTIEQDYGTNDDFKRLIAECHKRGIKVIIDLVMNHTSSRHPAFIASKQTDAPEHEWYVWTEANPGYKGPWNQTVWHQDTRAGSPSRFYYGLFGSDMPDLNFRSKGGGASDMMLDVTRSWLADYALDGYRLDAVRHLIEDGRRQDNTLATHDWLKGFRSHYKSINPQAMCVGEIWASTEVASSYVGDQMDLAFEFELAQAMVDSVKAGDATRVRNAQEKVLKWYPPNQYATFLTNHDQPRIMTQLKGNADARGAARVAAAMLLTSPGVPFLYYGEEIGMTGDKPDPDIRTPMPWSAEPNAGFSTIRPWRAVNRGAETVNVAAETNDKTSLLSLYRNLIALRNSHPALSHGDYTSIDAGSKSVYAFMRSDQGKIVLVVINLTAKPVEEYGLRLDASLLSEKGGLRFLFGGEGAIAKPRLDDQGAFTAWRPIDPLTPHHCAVIEFISPP